MHSFFDYFSLWVFFAITLSWICLFGAQSSGSGSESGIQTQKCAKPNTGDEYENNSTSNHDDDDENDDDEDDDLSIGLNARDGSDNGSGTQVCVH
jgi:hypothetical protein